MLKNAIAAAALALTLWSGAAAARPMLVTINGDFNDDPVWSYWQLRIRYDSDLGVTTFTPGVITDDTIIFARGTLAWDQAMGTPSPVSAVYGYVVPLTDPPSGGDPPPTYHFLFTDPTSVEFNRGDTFDNFHVTGPGWGVHLGEFAGLGPEHPTDYRFDTEWSRVIVEYGSWDINLGTLMPHVHGLVTVQRLAVPEPATWALMILGFGMAGAALRRRRGAYAP